MYVQPPSRTLIVAAWVERRSDKMETTATMERTMLRDVENRDSSGEELIKTHLVGW